MIRGDFNAWFFYFSKQLVTFSHDWNARLQFSWFYIDPNCYLIIFCCFFARKLGLIQWEWNGWKSSNDWRKSHLIFVTAGAKISRIIWMQSSIALLEKFGTLIVSQMLCKSVPFNVIYLLLFCKFSKIIST